MKKKQENIPISNAVCASISALYHIGGNQLKSFTPIANTYSNRHSNAAITTIKLQQQQKYKFRRKLIGLYLRQKNIK